MKFYSKVIAVAAIAAAASCHVQAAGLFDSIASAVSSATTAAATTGTAVASTASSIASAVAAMIPAAPATSSSTANDYMSKFSSLASQALAAYQSKDILKAAQLYPQVQEMYNQGTTALSGLTGSEAQQATDWKSKVMSVVTTAAGALVK